MKELIQYDELLRNLIRNLGYNVNSSISKNKACHHPDYIVFLKKTENIEQVYSIAHEVGHCMDFKNGKLDFNRYRMNKKYRIKKEIVAWIYAFRICLKNDIPLGRKFFKHSIYCLKSYFK